MSMSRFCLGGVLVAATIQAQALSATAASSTAKGEISVTQVMEMLSEAAKNPTAKQVLVAYLAGLGEAAGMRLNASPVTSCKVTLLLSDGASSSSEGSTGSRSLAGNSGHAIDRVGFD